MARRRPTGLDLISSLKIKSIMSTGIYVLPKLKSVSSKHKGFLNNILKNIDVIQWSVLNEVT